jgi:hypothetical protein
MALHHKTVPSATSAKADVFTAKATATATGAAEASLR